MNIYWILLIEIYCLYMPNIHYVYQFYLGNHPFSTCSLCGSVTPFPYPHSQLQMGHRLKAYHQGILLNADYDLIGLEWGLRVCISIKPRRYCCCSGQILSNTQTIEEFYFSTLHPTHKNDGLRNGNVNQPAWLKYPDN